MEYRQYGDTYYIRMDRGDEIIAGVLEGVLELVALNGNVVTGPDGEYHHHTHALMTFKQDGEHRVAGGHTKSLEVLYTGEIELRPVSGGCIGWRFNPETGTGFWDFGD